MNNYMNTIIVWIKPDKLLGYNYCVDMDTAYKLHRYNYCLDMDTASQLHGYNYCLDMDTVCSICDLCRHVHYYV